MEPIVPFDTIMFALLKASIKFAIPNMVLTLAFINIKPRKYLLSQRIVFLVA